MNKAFHVIVALLFMAQSGASQSTGDKSVIRLDPGLDAIVAPDAQLEQLTDSPGAGTREGPVWSSKEEVLFYSDMGRKSINRWNPRTNTVDVIQDSTNSDGLALDEQGRILWAEGTGHIIRLEEDGKRTVLASDSDSLPVKKPNDLIYKADGSIYFTDTFKTNHRVYLLRKDGKLVLLDTNGMEYPNGLALTPDGKYLYINDSAKRTVVRFKLRQDGTIADGKVIIDMKACEFPCADGYPDGMKVDAKGNIYVTGAGGIWITSPSGKHLGTILVPDKPANLAFGGPDGKTLFFTARPGLYRMRMKVAGLKP
ncbi:MAG TPA: SMP-30/gluconolactonase/LRE family protein [Acidobacteriaceae bacterium]|jgi:gluconolactonase